MHAWRGSNLGSRAALAAGAHCVQAKARSVTAWNRLDLLKYNCFGGESGNFGLSVALRGGNARAGPISRGGANIVHPELVVSERSARVDGIAINSGVKIPGSRLDMTKRARKTLLKLPKSLKCQNDATLRHLTYLEARGNFHVFFTGVDFLDYLNVRDGIGANCGVRIPVSIPFSRVQI